MSATAVLFGIVDRAQAIRLTREALIFAGVDTGETLEEMISEVKRLGVGGRDTTYGVGKKMGDQTWVHKAYEHVFPEAALKKAKAKLPDDFSYAVVRYNRKDGSLAFIDCADFDTADEPTVGDSVKISKSGDVKRTAAPSDPLIWHHKWTFVADDYEGFDVHDSVARSIEWKTKLGKDSKMSSRIGRKSVWEDEVVPQLATADAEHKVRIPKSLKSELRYREEVVLNSDPIPDQESMFEKIGSASPKLTTDELVALLAEVTEIAHIAKENIGWETGDRKKEKRALLRGANAFIAKWKPVIRGHSEDRYISKAAAKIDKRALNKLVRATRAALKQLGDSILKPQYRGSENPMTGHCYAATDALYWMLGGKEAGWKPMGITHEDSSHWYLKHVPTGTVIDATDSQFCTPVPHDKGKGRGFPRPKIGGQLGPGKAAQQVIKLVKKKLGEIPPVVTGANMKTVTARLRPVYWHNVQGSVYEIRALLDKREIKRHKTAISRKDFSVPIKALLKKGMLKKGVTLFDYGCGRGDDIRLLKAKGYSVGGWDPYHAPKNKKTKADIVNIGFVLNVIEDPEERDETLAKAFKLAKGCLVVSTRPPMKHSFKAYGDGFVTGSDTFQKFWKTDELKSWLEKVTGVEPVSSGSSCCYFLFKNDKAKERLMG